MFRKRNCAVCRRQTCAPAFLTLTPLVRATIADCSLGFSCPECFRRLCPPAYAPDVSSFHFSLFILHHSLFPLGAVTPQKPRIAACTANAKTVRAAGSQRGVPAWASRLRPVSHVSPLSVCCVPAPRGGGDNPRERGVVAALRSPLSLRFSPPCPRFPDSHPSGARRSRCVLLGFSCPECFRRLRPPAYAPDVSSFHFSLFILHHSPFTFSAGSSHATEAAISGVYNECLASHAAALRRGMEAGTARPNENAPKRLYFVSGHCFR